MFLLGRCAISPAHLQRLAVEGAGERVECSHDIGDGAVAVGGGVRRQGRFSFGTIAGAVSRQTRLQTPPKSTLPMSRSCSRKTSTIFPGIPRHMGASF